MADHVILGVLLVVSTVLQVCGILILGSMLRECQRLTRAVAGLVYQDGERTRAALSARPSA